MIKPILIAPHPALRQKSQPANPSDPQVSQVIKDLTDTLAASKIPGVGLSAPQIGVNQRVFVAVIDKQNNQRLKPKEATAKRPPRPTLHAPSSNLKIFINPKIIWASKKSNIKAEPVKNLYLEGCLSIPRIYALIRRPYQIKLRWLCPDPGHPTSSPQQFTSEFSGFAATLIQHEIDHLNGVLFTDLAIKQNTPIYQDKKGKLEEVVI